MPMPNDSSDSEQDEINCQNSPRHSTMVLGQDHLDGIETPNTSEVIDVPLKPDITIFCDKMKCYVDIRHLREHRNMLDALAIMKYKDNNKPDEIAKLFHRRNNLIKQLRSKVGNDDLMDPREVQKINHAYELLKSNLEQTFESHRRVRKSVDTEVRGIALNCSPRCVQAVGICSSANEKWKNSMEDTRVYQDGFGGDATKCFLGIYDGHNGRFAAEVAATELHRLLLYEMSKFDPRTKEMEAGNLADESILSRYVFERPSTKESERVILFEESVDIVQQIVRLCQEKYESLMQEKIELPKEKLKDKLKSHESRLSENISSAFKKVYYLIDILLSYGKDEFSKVRWSGCSTLNLILQDCSKHVTFKDDISEDDDANLPYGYRDTEDPLGVIHLANAGNARALLIRGNRSYRISRDHTPSNQKEKTRLLKEGATLSESKKDVLVNGVLATTRGLGNHGDLKLKKCLLVEPYTTCVPIDGFAQLLVLASNGVWEVFSDDEVTSLLVQLLPDNHIPPPDRLSSSLKLFISTLSQVSRCPSAATTEQIKIIRNQRHPASSISSTENEMSPREEKRRRKPKTNMDDHDCTEIPEEIENADESGAGDCIGQKDGDLCTEAGSLMGDNSDHESGHEADVETIGDGSRLALSRLSEYLPSSREEMQREVAKAMSEYLVQAALLAGAKDNITVFVALLPGSGL